MVDVKCRKIGQQVRWALPAGDAIVGLPARRDVASCAVGVATTSGCHVPPSGATASSSGAATCAARPASDTWMSTPASSAATPGD